jgi:hypothetical protein
MTSRTTDTRATVSTLAIVSGIMTVNALICWRSVADRAMSWPVWAPSWYSKSSSCSLPNIVCRRSVSTAYETLKARYRLSPEQVAERAPSSKMAKA